MIREPVVVGRVTSTDGRFTHDLDSAGRWTVRLDGLTVPLWGALLDAVYRDEFEGPAYGPMGAAALRDLAERVHGKFEYFGPSGVDPEVVY